MSRTLIQHLIYLIIFHVVQKLGKISTIYNMKVKWWSAYYDIVGGTVYTVYEVMRRPLKSTWFDRHN